MAQVRMSDNESFETALKRFSRKIQQEGVLAETHRREHYKKPCVKCKRKEAARQRKMLHKA
ncbi:MAG: 30S ribosomal protein S21 [Ktedonobacteraceae bacterium]